MAKITAERKAEIKAERERRNEVYRRNLEITGERSEYGRKERESKEREANRFPKLEKLQDEYLNWLAYYSPTHPKWDEVVSRYHAVEVQIKALTTRKPDFSGIDELSTITLKAK